MKSLFKISVIAGLLAIFAISCSKDRLENNISDQTNRDTNKDNQTTAEYVSMDEFYKNNAPEEQSFTIDTTKGDTLRGKDGSKIWGLRDSIYMLKSTHTDIKYPYVLKLIEAYSLKNMILSKLPNLAQAKLLHSAGEVKLTAFKDNDELVLKEHRGIHIMSPAKPVVSGMSVFYGFMNGTTDDWNTELTKTDYLFPTDDVTSITTNAYGYIFKDAKLGWSSINKFNISTDKANITFTSDDAGTSFIDIYIVFKNLHSYIKVNSLAADGLPVGEPIKIIAFAKEKAGTMYSFTDEFTITTSAQIKLTMNATTEADVLTLLGSL